MLLFRMKTTFKIIFLSLLNLYALLDNVIENGSNKTRSEKQLGIFTVVKFPNDPCGGKEIKNRLKEKLKRADF